MSRFQALRDDIRKQTSKPATIAVAPRAGGSRAGKRTIAGHFSERLSKRLNVIAVEENTTVQALLGEAIDMLIRSRGGHPYGER
jgi:hypothetical protein